MKKLILVSFFISTAIHATKYYEILTLQQNNFKALASLMEVSDALNQSIQFLNGRARAMDKNDLYSYDTEPSRERIEEKLEEIRTEISATNPKFPQEYFATFQANLQQGIERADAQKIESERPASGRNKKK